MKRKHKFGEEYQASCPVCGAILKTKSGLVGHLALAHGVKAAKGQIDELAIVAPDGKASYTPSADTAGVKPDMLNMAHTSSMAHSVSGPGGPQELKKLPVSELRNQVEFLKLQSEKDKLLSGRQDARLPDLSEKLGFGSFVPAVAEQIQNRAFGVQQQPQKSSIAEGLEIVEKVKSIFGNNNSELELLSKMGLNLKDLIELKRSPVAPDTLSVGGVSLQGVSLTPGVLHDVFMYRAVEKEAEAKEAAAKAEAARSQGIQDLMADFFQKLGANLPAVVDGIKGGISSNTGSRVSSAPVIVEGKLGESGEISCCRCASVITIDAKQDEVRCSMCGQNYKVERVGAAKPEVGAQPETEHPFKCPVCGKETFLSNFPDDSPFVCPGCSQDSGRLVGQLKLEMVEGK